MTPSADPTSCRSLLADQRGLSTMEYAVLFIIILVGALVAWSTLGEDLEAQLRGGTGTVSETLSGRTGVAPSTGTGTPRPPTPSTPPQGSGTGSGASSNKRALTGR